MFASSSNCKTRRDWASNRNQMAWNTSGWRDERLLLTGSLGIFVQDNILEMDGSEIHIVTMGYSMKDGDVHANSSLEEHQVTLLTNVQVVVMRQTVDG